MRSVLEWIVLVLVTIGGINWGLYGLFNFNLVEVIFRVGWLITTVYALVGLAGLYMIFYLFKK